MTQWITRQEAANALACSLRQIDKLRKSEPFEEMSLGNRIRLSQNSIDNFVSKNRRPGNEI